jgi:hypothetical protein
LYVTLASHTPGVGSPQYAAIDTDDNLVSFTTTSHDPAAPSHAPHPSLDVETVYVAHDLGDEVTGIDVETGDIEFTVEPILRAEEAIATRFGNLLWVSSRGDGTVKRIDLDTREITASVSALDVAWIGTHLARDGDAVPRVELERHHRTGRQIRIAHPIP